MSRAKMKSRIVIDIETDMKHPIVFDADSEKQVDMTDEVEDDLHYAVKKAIESRIDIVDDEFVDCITDNQLESNPEDVTLEDYGLKITITEVKTSD